MDKNIMFSILQLEETKDTEVIKNAYRKLLAEVNPEENPEGFKRLREAYEAAVSYAAQSEDNGEKEKVKRPDTPVGRWLDRVEEVYGSLKKRIDEAEWEILFKDDVCIDLETSMEAKNELFYFLASHFRMPSYIWKMVDASFSVRENVQEFYELHPRDFIDFIIRQCESTGGFPYDMLEGEDTADYDTFLYHYYELVQKLNETLPEEAGQILKELDALNISHPYLESERARYLYQSGRKQEAFENMKECCSKYPEDLQILLTAALLFDEDKQTDQMAECCRNLLLVQGNHYYANKQLAHYYMQKGDYSLAKEHCSKALRVYSQEEDLLEDLHTINEKLLDEYRENKDQKAANIKDRLELAWCFLQNEFYDEGVAFLRLVAPIPGEEDEYVAEYENLLARFYISLNCYQDAIDHALKGIERMEIDKTLPGEDRDRIPLRIGHNYEIISKSYQLLYLANKEQSQYFDSSILYIDKAIALEPKNQQHYYEKTKIYLENSDYQKAFDVCDEMIRLDSGYFWAYVQKQEACHGLRDAQGVIDNFYAAKDIYAGYPGVYEQAVLVFLDYTQPNDALNILKQAEENNVTSAKLRLYHITVKRIMAEENAEYRTALKEAAELMEKFEKENQDDEVQAELHYEMARINRYLDQEEKALICISNAVNKKKENRYLWVKANIFLTMSQYQQALELYEICAEEWKDSDIVYENMGCCYQNLKQSEKAMECFKKAISLNPENSSVNSRITDLYIDNLRDKGRRKDYEEGIVYADRQIELRPDVHYYYNDRGRMHLSACKWDLAIKDFKKVLELKPDDLWGHNNLGCIYKYTQRYEEALEEFFLAARTCEEEGSTLPYGNIADTYVRMGDYENAVKYYYKNKEVFKDNEDVDLEDVIQIYCKQGRFLEAMELLDTVYESGSETYFITKGRLLLDMGHKFKALYYTKKAVQISNEGVDSLRALGNIYLYGFLDPKKALKYFGQACDKQKNGLRKRELMLDVMDCHYLMNRTDNALLVRDYYYKALHEAFEDVEDFLDNYRNYMSNLLELASIEILSRRTAEATEYIERAGKAPMCFRCNSKECTDYWYVLGTYKEMMGEPEEAIKHYEKALSIDQSKEEAFARIRFIKKRK